MNKQTGLLGKEASRTKRTDTSPTLMKRPSSKPSPRKNGSSNTQTLTNQTASTNWTDLSRLFCSGWDHGTTDLIPHTASSKVGENKMCIMQHRHHDYRTSTAALPTTWCFEMGHVARTDTTEDKPYGNLEELRRTATFVRATSISV